MAKMNLARGVAEYGQFRDAVVENVLRLQVWMRENELLDEQGELRFELILNRLHDNRLTVAFVAEFSRGKSELINAIFFADYDGRILPSSSGRTTMCPTELLWHEDSQPRIRLLPIESASQGSVTDLKQEPDAWTTVLLEDGSAEELRSALNRVRETMRVSTELCQELGFAIDLEGKKGLQPDHDGNVEIPRWRHALVELRHPLLEQGLVVLDTPGLNAIGAEPELTFSLLPNADAVLFILAADTGVTKSDLSIWRDYVQPRIAGGRSGQLVALNKIDGLWDGLRDEGAIGAEIDEQVRSVAEMLELPQKQIFPLSAQKALVGRIQRDTPLIERSRIESFEQALTENLLPTKRHIMVEYVFAVTEDITRNARNHLLSRQAGLQTQLGDLVGLRGKNHKVIEYMMSKIVTEKNAFDEALKQYYAVRSVLSTQSGRLLAALSANTVAEKARRVRSQTRKSFFLRSLRREMDVFFNFLRGNIESAEHESAEIIAMLGAMYKRFSVEHGLRLSDPEAFSLLRYTREIDRLREVYERNSGGIRFIFAALDQRAVTKKMFNTIATQARLTFEQASLDAEQWLGAVISPLELQLRESQLQFKRRIDGIKRISETADTLEPRVAELEATRNEVQDKLVELAECNEALLFALGVEDED